MIKNFTGHKEFVLKNLSFFVVSFISDHLVFFVVFVISDPLLNALCTQQFSERQLLPCYGNRGLDFSHRYVVLLSWCLAISTLGFAHSEDFVNLLYFAYAYLPLLSFLCLC